MLAGFQSGSLDASWERYLMYIIAEQGTSTVIMPCLTCIFFLLTLYFPHFTKKLSSLSPLLWIFTHDNERGKMCRSLSAFSVSDCSILVSWNYSNDENVPENTNV